MGVPSIPFLGIPLGIPGVPFIPLLISLEIPRLAIILGISLEFLGPGPDRLMACITWAGDWSSIVPACKPP